MKYSQFCRGNFVCGPVTRRPLRWASTPNPPRRHTRTESTRWGNVKPGVNCSYS